MSNGFMVCLAGFVQLLTGQCVCVVDWSVCTCC